MGTRPDGWDLGFFTFTEPARASLDLASLKRRHDATIKRLRRLGWIGEYCTAVEFQRRGALHPHVIAHVPNELLRLLPEHGQEKRDRAQYRWHFDELVPLAVELGWGPMVDAREVTTSAGAASYATKGLAGYATKEAHARFKAAGAKRVRPVRFSTGWTREGLRAFQRGALVADDPGPWLDISQIGPCQ
jgi:hypothetical protein